jgi:hypothetical protein
VKVAKTPKRKESKMDEINHCVICLKEVTGIAWIHVDGEQPIITKSAHQECLDSKGITGYPDYEQVLKGEQK